jgi:MYXO-CTERM domain-containing protein
VAQGVTDTQFATPSSLQEDKVHYWRARASDGFTTGDWFVGNFKVNATNGAPSIPVLLNPQDGTLATTQSPTLIVLNAEDPEGEAITYDFEIHKETATGDVVAAATNVTAGLDQTSFAGQDILERGKPYYWRARAVDVNGLAGEWSAPALFQIQGGCGCTFGGAGGLLPMALLALGLLRLRRRK